MAAGCAGSVGVIAQPAPRGDIIEVDPSELREGELKTIHWRDKPVWILRRTAQMLADLNDARLRPRLADPDSALGGPAVTPAYALNPFRSIEPEVFVGVALCPHAGCVPVPRLQPGPHPERADNWPGGFACQCHFATFDLAGRVFKGKPAQENLPVPRHMYRSPRSLVIGRDAEGAA
jgi:ubiquinol-cytochrome c reductase iron-sulfur subunit